MSDIYDELGDESTGLTRRQVIKRVGIGAAVAWAAPAVTTLGARAYAVGGSPRCTGCDYAACGDTPGCGLHECVCGTDVAGNAFCAQNAFCACLPDGPDCPPGWHHVDRSVCGFCVNKCIPECGTCADCFVQSGTKFTG